MVSLQHKSTATGENTLGAGINPSCNISGLSEGACPIAETSHPIPLLFLKKFRQCFPPYLLQGVHGLTGTSTGIKGKLALRQQLCNVFLQTEGSSFLQGMLVFNACVRNPLQTAPMLWHCLPLGMCVCFGNIAFHGPTISPNISSETSWQSCLNSAKLPGKCCLIA